MNVATAPYLIDTGPSERGWHRIENMLICPQRFAFANLLKLHPPSEPLTRGTLGHVGLAHYYARTMAIQHRVDPNRYYSPLDAVDQKVNRLLLTNEKDFALKFQQPIKDVLAVYMRDFAREQLQVLGVEVAVEIHFGPHRMTQRIDLVVEDLNRRVWFWDHKFTGRGTNAIEQRYAQSGQFLLMTYMGHKYFPGRFAGVRVNVVGVDDQKIRRDTPPAAPFALQCFPSTVRFAEERIALLANVDPWGYPKASSEHVCIGPYGACPFFEKCQWGPGGDAP